MRAKLSLTSVLFLACALPVGAEELLTTALGTKLSVALYNRRYEAAA